MSARGERLRRELGERRLEMSRAPFFRAALTGLALTAAGAAVRRPREGIIAGLAAAAVVRDAAADAAVLDRRLRDSEDLTAIAPRLGPRSASLGNWAVDADFGRLVLAEAEARTGLLVELGSGASTRLIASLLAERGTGALVSFDHDSRFGGQSAEQLRQMGVDRAEVVVAPLQRQSFDGTEVDWYDTEAVLAALPEDEQIELLVVDGPPMASTWSRWPALEVLGPRLAPGAVILLDDGRRRQERSTALRWAREHPELKLCWHDTLKGAWRLEACGEVSESFGRRWGRTALRLLNPNPTGFGRWPVRR